MKTITDGTKRNEKFELLCSKSQQEIEDYLLGTYKEAVKGDGYIYLEGEIPIILTAHMDTVHKELPREIIYKEGTVSSPQGIGGDDRCGIYMIMEIIKEFKCHVLFFEDEEKGGVGSEKFLKTELCESLKGKIHFAIDFDRMNANDAVFYNCENFKFEEFITREFWKTAYGSFTDICVICPRLGCAGVNLSCGYYKQHRTEEYVVLSEMENAIEESKKLLKRTTDDDVYEWIEARRNFDGFMSNGNAYWDYGEMEYYITFFGDNGEEVDCIYANNEIEAIGEFLIEHPRLRYADIIDIDFDIC